VFDDITPDVTEIQWAKIRPDKLTPRDPDQPRTDHGQDTLVALMAVRTQSDVIDVLDRAAAVNRELYQAALDYIAELTTERDALKSRVIESNRHIATLLGLGE
jgi:hypothetical protein